MQELKLIWKKSNEKHGFTSQNDKIVKIYQLACLMLEIICRGRRSQSDWWLPVPKRRLKLFLYCSMHDTEKSGDDPKKVGRKALEKEGGTVKFNWIGNLTNMKYIISINTLWLLGDVCANCRKKN